ncbi:MAG: hypothetical protein M0R66_08985 [Candidatus Omnitrophica bacterium]|nr:hypothetical protein [Candidatus Omnitrophota bacterium]
MKIKGDKMKNYEVPLYVIFILIGIVILGIGIGVVKYVAFMEMRYDLLLDNTMMITDNVTRTFTSLESDKVMQQLSSRVGVLKKENALLKAELKKSERKLNNLSKIEKNCQARLNELTKCDRGNRGFLIKGGRVTSP